MEDRLNEIKLKEICRGLGLPGFFFERTDSTNTRAKEWFLHGGEGTALFVAGEQTSGRGRLGRSFYSPGNCGIYMSLVCPIKEGQREEIVSVTCASAVAVRRAIERCTQVQTSIKWVNDLYVRDKKVCGILAETVSYENRQAVVIGIGVNLNTKSFPDELRDIAGSVESSLTTRAELMEAILGQLLPFVREPANREWLPDYREHSCVIGKKIMFVRDGISVNAIATGIDGDGGLMVLCEDGKTEILRTGEITVRLRRE